MTIDDECSIYVGGLPYDATQDTLRTAFSIFGHVVAVKIINDRSTSGKCFGFVTFTNPRSAVDAINDMNGKTIRGRVVKVNDVKSRGGRSSFGKDSFRRESRDVERGREWDTVRKQDRDYERGTVNLPGRYRDRSREHGGSGDRSREHGGSRDRSREHDGSRERGYSSSHGYDSVRDRLPEREQGPEIALENNDRKHSAKRERDWEKRQVLDAKDVNTDMDRVNRQNRSVDNDIDQQSKKLNREIPSDRSYGHHHHEKESMNLSIKRREDLEKEISQMEERLREKQQFALDLQRKSEKLEDALVAAKKYSSHHQMQLIKLRKCFLQVKDNSERLKKSEEELQCLVDTIRIESGTGDEGSLRNGVLTNGRS